MKTYEAVLADVLPQAVTEAAQRFTAGDVPGQNTTFAPSIAAFVQEAKRIEKMMPYRDRVSVLPIRKPELVPSPAERVRMKFKMAIWAASMSRAGGGDELAAAMPRLDDLMALAQRWGVDIPDALWKQAEAA